MKKIATIVIFILTAVLSFSEADEKMVIKDILFKNLKEIPEEILKEKMELKKGISSVFPLIDTEMDKIISIAEKIQLFKSDTLINQQQINNKSKPLIFRRTKR